LCGESTCIIDYERILDFIFGVVDFFWTIGSNDVYRGPVDDERLVVWIGNDRTLEITMDRIVTQQRSSFSGNRVVFVAGHNGARRNWVPLPVFDINSLASRRPIRPKP
jgi:hypothetical protein